MTVTIISGASRGIGKAIVEDLKNEDMALVCLNSRNADLRNRDGVKKYLGNRLASFEHIHRINLVLCAAKVGWSKEINIEDCDRLFDINVLGNLMIIEIVKQWNVPMRIVWFAGGGAAFPFPEFFGYSLTKVAVVRAVENLSTMLGKEDSIVALAPGAVATDMLKTVKASGYEVRTETDISEPVNFIRKFITDEIDSKKYNGFFLHVRDDLSTFDGKKWKLRRLE